MRKGKTRVDRIIILILTSILVLGILGFGIYKLFGLFFSDEKKNDDNKIVVVETTDGVKVEIQDYTVYLDDTNSLNYNFIIANVKFEGKEPVKFDLGDLQTSEKIYLNDVNVYKQLLQEKGYKINELEIASYISSDQNSLVANIFIPYKTDADILQVYNLKTPSNSLKFDLTNNNKYITSLKFESDADIIVDNTSVKVSSCFVSSIMKHNDETYDIPSSVKVFTFKIFVNTCDKGVSITDAYFIKDGEENKIECMSSDYRATDTENILGKELVEGENGALFFETYSRDAEPNYDGVLMIKFSNSNEWVKLSTTLE